MHIRKANPQDLSALEALYPVAFPGEDLLPVVRDLSGAVDVALSLVAEAAGEIVGHIAFTDCRIEGSNARIAMLAPLVVAPTLQRQGIGGDLIREGQKRLVETGVGLVVVLGDPAYYGRFGFKPETRIAPPYPLPKEWAGAWQSLPLGAGDEIPSGKLDVPLFWQNEAYWSS